MIQKVHVPSGNIATFVCPQCEKPRRADVSKFGKLNRVVGIKVRCPCGHNYPVELERRLHKRLAVDFPGIAFRLTDGMRTDRFVMVVKDLSRGGLKMRLNNRVARFRPGDAVSVEFRLDDAHHSNIRKEAVIWMVIGPDIGVKFKSISARDPSDQALGFYFFP
jgi:hypothetical protein